MQASSATTMSPTLPVASRTSPTASASSPWASGDPVDRLEDRLLEGPPLGRPALALGLDLVELVLLVPQRLELLLQLPELLEQRALSRVGAPRGLLDLAHGRALEVGERVAIVGRRELADEVLARLRQRLRDRLAHAVLHRDGAAVPEAPLELLGELPLVLPEDLGELTLEVLGDRARLVGELLLDALGRLLELGLDVLGVRAGLLAVEHARADLDGVPDRRAPDRRRAARARARAGRHIRPPRPGRRRRPGRRPYAPAPVSVGWLPPSNHPP